MSEHSKPMPNNEEVDLGQLFTLIGKMFNKLFRFIGNIFKGIFNLFIYFLLFIKKHFLKFAIAGALGALLGFFLETQEETKYESVMIVEPNFNSVQQLYNNINFYNEIADANDSIVLSEALNISLKQASSIKGIEVEAYTDENQKIKLFDEFIKNLDTTTIKTIDFNAYMENFNTIDAQFHRITLTSTDSKVAKASQAAIINSIGNNAYFKLQKSISDQNIALQDSIYKSQFREVDSLQKIYRKVMLEVAKNPNLGTNINLAEEKGSENKELALIKQMDDLKKNVITLNEERAKKGSTINIISDFPSRGVKIKGIRNNKMFLFLLLFIGLTFIVLALLELNGFLTAFKAKKEG